MRALIKAVGKSEIRNSHDWGKTRDRARHYWSRLSPDEKNEVLQKASKDVARGSPDAEAIQTLADGIDMVGNRYRRNRSGCAAARANRNCIYKSRAILATYQSHKLVLATLDEWRGMSESMLVDRLKKDRDILRLIDLVGKDVDAVQTNVHAKEWSASLELCLETFRQEHKCRLHIHFVAVRPEGFRYSDGSRSHNLKLPRLEIKPSHMQGLVDPANGRKTKSTCPLHYYCQMPKKGLIASWTNHVAYKDFLVSPRWIVSFVQRGKMTHEDAKKVIVFIILS